MYQAQDVVSYHSCIVALWLFLFT